MAVVTVRMLRGAGSEIKRKLARAVTMAVSDTLAAPHTSVVVLIEEYAPENWAEGGELQGDRGKTETMAYDLEALFRKPPERPAAKPAAAKPAANPSSGAKASPRKAAARSRSRR
ncbi:MAG TPA: tautomerase family protein [Rhizomicrobium sp.]|nr:tautomerase family protein [Rhizomicrobium sp.]